MAPHHTAELGVSGADSQIAELTRRANRYIAG